MALVARRILVHVVMPPQILGTVATSSALISRAGVNGQALQELGWKGSRQTIRCMAFFSSLANAQAWTTANVFHKGHEARIITAGPPVQIASIPVDIQGLIHDIVPSLPYAVTTSHSRGFTHAIDVDIDYTRTA